MKYWCSLSVQCHFSFYLQHLIESTHSLLVVQEVMNAMCRLKEMSGQEPIAIAQSVLVQAMLAGLKRSLARPKINKKPVIVRMLTALVQSLEVPPSVSKLKLAASCFLAFTTFLLCDKLAKLRCCNSTFREASMTVQILSSKQTSIIKVTLCWWHALIPRPGWWQ